MTTLSFSDFRKPVRYEIAGGYVLILPMMASDYVELQKGFSETKDIDPALMAKVVAKGVVDDDLVPILTEQHAMQLSPGTLAELFVQCTVASGFKAKDDPEKN